MDISTYMKDLIEVWVKGSLVTLDMFFNSLCEISAKIRSHVDIDKVAAFGMSFGGNTALKLTVESDLIKVGANLGGMIRLYAEWDGTINKPFLLMRADNPSAVVRNIVLSLLNTTNDFYLAEIKNCSHVNFTDYNDILAVDENGFLGDIAPNIMEQIMNTLILDFFNKYFKLEKSKHLDADFWKEHIIISNK